MTQHAIVLHMAARTASPPVDRKVYDESIEILARAVAKARVERTDKREALTRLDRAFR